MSNYMPISLPDLVNQISRQAGFTAAQSQSLLTTLQNVSNFNQSFKDFLDYSGEVLLNTGAGIGAALGRAQLGNPQLQLTIPANGASPTQIAYVLVEEIDGNLEHAYFSSNPVDASRVPTDINASARIFAPNDVLADSWEVLQASKDLNGQINFQPSLPSNITNNQFLANIASLPSTDAKLSYISSTIGSNSLNQGNSLLHYLQLSDAAQSNVDLSFQRAQFVSFYDGPNGPEAVRA